MRSGAHGAFATLLLMIPVLAIPALAIFGIPQIVPVVSSPLDEGSRRDNEHRVGHSERPSVDGYFTQNERDQDSFLDEKPDSSPEEGRIGDAVSVESGPGFGKSVSNWDRDEAPRRPTLPTKSPEAPFGEAPQIEGRRPNESRSVTDARDELPASRRPVNQRLAPEDRALSAEQSDPIRSSFDSNAANQREQPARRPMRPQMNAAGNDVVRQVAAQEPVTDINASDRFPPRPYLRERDPSNNLEPQERQPTVSRQPLTWQSAVQRLNDLEIRNYRIEPGRRSNQFIFICSYTPKNSPRVSNRFEAEADEPLKAVEKVLEQIEEWQKNGGKSTARVRDSR